MRRYLDGSLIVLDHELTFVAVTTGYAAMLGWRPRDLVGVPGLDLVDLDESKARAAHAARMRIIAAGGIVDDVAALVARDGGRILYAHTARAVMGGALYVLAGEPVPGERELLESVGPVAPLIGEWLTKAEAVAYTKISESTLDRAVHDGILEAGGTPGRRLFKREWLDAWLIARLGPLAVLAALLVILATLLVVEAVDLVTPGDLGFPLGLDLSTSHARPNLRVPARRVDNDRLKRTTRRA